MFTPQMIVEHWADICVDLHETFGVDVDDPTLHRTWPWLYARIVAVAARPGTRLHHILFAT
ncbi:hypothetical protein [Actinobaculum sp. 352]|uniref:hypothetical protein n=1 Tax=Actinobaculum sp. 352 TaxID=2490946 RepID=UPI0013E0182F|nr:hypothetical protein [Actinobaculum sp. 352]